MADPKPRMYSSEEINRLHAAMVDAIVASNTFANRLIEPALRAIPRHVFLPTTDIGEAYADAAIATAWNDKDIPVSSSTQPSLMALMIDQLDLRPGHNVLEIGTATGYNAAILRHIVGDEGRVVTIDIDENLVAAARGNLRAAGIDDVLAVTSDGSRGYPAGAPFDRIIVTVGCPDIPPGWREQLAADGVLVVPLALVNDYQKSLALVWRDGHLESRSSLDCRFVALRGEHSEVQEPPVAIGDIPSIAMHPELDDPRSIDPVDVHRLLAGNHVDYATGVTVSARELALRLLPGVAFLVPHTFWLAITERALEESDIPGLFTIEGRQRAAFGALGDEGAALLLRDGAGAEADQEESFSLVVRAYGSDHRTAEALVAAVRDWDRRGRVGDENVRVSVWPAGAEPDAGERDLVIRRPSSVIVITTRAGETS